MIELKRTVHEFKIDGEVYKVRMPTRKEVEVFSEKAKEKKEKANDYLDELIVKLGIPKDVWDGLDLDLQEIVIKAVMPAKKKSVSPS